MKSGDFTGTTPTRNKLVGHDLFACYCGGVTSIREPYETERSWWDSQMSDTARRRAIALWRESTRFFSGLRKSVRRQVARVETFEDQERTPKPRCYTQTAESGNEA